MRFSSFSDWLHTKEQQAQETSTSTGDIAHFARPFLVDPVDRTHPEPLTVDMLEKRKKKNERKAYHQKNM